MEGTCELWQVYITNHCDLLPNLFSETDLTKVKKRSLVSNPIGTFQY